MAWKHAIEHKDGISALIFSPSEPAAPNPRRGADEGMRAVVAIVLKDSWASRS